MSAYPGTNQLYGRAKLETERIALKLGMAAVRLGLVYGPGWGGMAGSLKKMADLPVIPIVAGKILSIHSARGGSRSRIRHARTRLEIA